MTTSANDTNELFVPFYKRDLDAATTREFRQGYAHNRNELDTTELTRWMEFAYQKQFGTHAPNISKHGPQNFSAEEHLKMLKAPAAINPNSTPTPHNGKEADELATRFVSNFAKRLRLREILANYPTMNVDAKTLATAMRNRYKELVIGKGLNERSLAITFNFFFSQGHLPKQSEILDYAEVVAMAAALHDDAEKAAKAKALALFRESRITGLNKDDEIAEARANPMTFMQILKVLSFVVSDAMEAQRDAAFMAEEGEEVTYTFNNDLLYSVAVAEFRRNMTLTPKALKRGMAAHSKKVA